MYTYMSCHGYSLCHNELNIVMTIRMKNTIVFAHILVYFGRINNMKIRKLYTDLNIVDWVVSATYRYGKEFENGNFENGITRLEE